MPRLDLGVCEISNHQSRYILNTHLLVSLEILNLLHDRMHTYVFLLVHFLFPLYSLTKPLPLLVIHSCFLNVIDMYMYTLPIAKPVCYCASYYSVIFIVITPILLEFFTVSYVCSTLKVLFLLKIVSCCLLLLKSEK